jgi:glycosyltransferase involved in cell wall biosynthesis
MLLSQTNSGQAVARNVALKSSKGRYVAFVDSDDIMLDNSIEALLDAAYGLDADVIDSSYKTIDDSGSTISLFAGKNGKINSLQDLLGFPWGKVYKRELFYKQQFPNYTFEDTVILSTLITENMEIYRIADYTIGYRIHNSGTTAIMKGNNKSIDSLWIAKQLHKDRKALGIPNTQSYYEYLLGHVMTTYDRCFHLSKEYKSDIFMYWCDFFEEFKEYKSINTERVLLEKSIKTRNFSLYYVWNNMYSV